MEENQSKQRFCEPGSFLPSVGKIAYYICHPKGILVFMYELSVTRNVHLILHQISNMMRHGSGYSNNRESRDTFSIHVGNVPSDAHKDELKEIFSTKCSDGPLDVYISPSSHCDALSTTFAFVRYRSLEDVRMNMTWDFLLTCPVAFTSTSGKYLTI